MSAGRMSKFNDVDDYAKFPWLGERAAEVERFIPKLKYYRDFADYINETNHQGWGANHFSRSFAWLLEHAEPLNFYYTYAEWVLNNGNLDSWICFNTMRNLLDYGALDVEGLHPKMRKMLEDEDLIDVETSKRQVLEPEQIVTSREANAR
mgnify:FL=1